MLLKTSSFFSRATDLLALVISFLLFASLFYSGEDDEYLIRSILIYVIPVFICLRLCKRLFFVMLIHKSRVLCILLGNISGLAVGTILVLIIMQFLPSLEEKAIAIIASSVLAFFILGTISPLVKSSQRDIIFQKASAVGD